MTHRRTVRHLARRALPAALLGVLALAAAACGSGAGEKAAEAASPFTEVSAGTIEAGDAIPALNGEETILTLKGGATTNAPGELRLTLSQLEQMHTVKATVYEPFLKRDVEFQGVPFSEIVAIAGYGADVTELDTVALNEYAVTIPTSILRHPGVLLATLADGKPIPLDEGGPTRVVFTDDHPDTRNESLWIWSLATVTPG